MLDHVFVHIPATAGTSVRAALGVRRIVHDLARNHHRSYGVQWDRYFKFSIVRNTYDRAVSLCAKVFECRPNARRTGPLTPEKFRQWLADGMPDTRIAQHAQSPRMCTPQLDYLTDEHGTWLVDHVLRFEDLDTEIPALCDLLGIKHRSVQNLNPSARTRDHRVYYDQETRKLVEKRYERDLNQWHHPF